MYRLLRKSARTVSCTWAAALVLSVLAAGAAGRVSAQESDPAASEAPAPKIAFTKGPATVDIGTMAQVELPPNYLWAGPADTRTLLERMGNLTSGNELAFISPGDDDWFVAFEFNELGYVKDDEKDKLDADAILASLKKGNQAGNEERRRRGMSDLTLVGWEVPPAYNAETNNLEWATRLRSAKGGDSVNYNVRILGRTGVMEATLVANPEDVKKSMPAFRTLLSAYSYKSGSKYSEFRSGDKIAAYGLTALVVGGAVAAAAKTGLLGKLLKPLLIGLVALAVAVKKALGSMFGRNVVNPDPRAGAAGK
ncbi:MAG: DUF2167 domain-containing protein [Planctomycetes bacterium]|nr:DUF2167 domain-containing protein [Planctomycetota bacterium]